MEMGGGGGGVDCSMSMMLGPRGGGGNVCSRRDGGRPSGIPAEGEGRSNKEKVAEYVIRRRTLRHVCRGGR